jgi:hypothetical protein
MSQSENRDPSLADALRALAHDDANVGASAGVEGRLLLEVRAIALARRRRQYRAGLAVAAAVLVTFAVATWRLRTFHPPTNRAATLSPSTTGEIATAFLPLLYSNVPVTDGQLVRVELPRTALASFGLVGIESSDDSSAATVLADVIVGEDGLARAIRFVRSPVY